MIVLGIQKEERMIQLIDRCLSELYFSYVDVERGQAYKQ